MTDNPEEEGTEAGEIATESSQANSGLKSILQNKLFQITAITGTTLAVFNFNSSKTTSRFLQQDRTTFSENSKQPLLFEINASVNMLTTKPNGEECVRAAVAPGTGVSGFSTAAETAALPPKDTVIANTGSDEARRVILTQKAVDTALSNPTALVSLSNCFTPDRGVTITTKKGTESITPNIFYDKITAFNGESIGTPQNSAENIGSWAGNTLSALSSNLIVGTIAVAAIAHTIFKKSPNASK